MSRRDALRRPKARVLLHLDDNYRSLTQRAQLIAALPSASPPARSAGGRSGHAATKHVRSGSAMLPVAHVMRATRPTGGPRATLPLRWRFSGGLGRRERPWLGGLQGTSLAGQARMRSKFRSAAGRGTAQPGCHSTPSVPIASARPRLGATGALGTQGTLLGGCSGSFRAQKWYLPTVEREAARMSHVLAGQPAAEMCPSKDGDPNERLPTWPHAVHRDGPGRAWGIVRCVNPH